MTDMLKREAGRLLYEYGLLDILKEYGTPHVIGSVSMDLMAWPDLDIDVTNTGMCLEKLHRLRHAGYGRCPPG